ncbi:MAG TPA: pyridoxal-phosphate dependent enzyme, partial [Muribaculaceae bacterium]|nr:pyridoxal-phosphate dependent enzyme [Muribaculaceae bacterium]
MQYISTGHNSPSVTLAQAVLCSHAPDGGLYMPASLPQIPDAFFRNFQGMTASEIAYVLATHFFSDDIPAQALKEMVDRTINFDIPLRRIDNDIYVLELFGGPTLTFKDIGARFMASLLRHIGTGSLPLNIIVASCGNTAGAIANAMAPLSSVNVFVLFPRNSSNRQLERQYTTLGGNIHAIEVHGNIDDCLALMRQALSDPVLQRKAMMTCANSANIGRLLPETFYYF